MSSVKKKLSKLLCKLPLDCKSSSSYMSTFKKGLPIIYETQITKTTAITQMFISSIFLLISF